MAYERDDDRYGRGPTADRYEQRPRDYDRGGSQHGYGQAQDRPRGDHGRDDHRQGPGGRPGGPRGGESRYGRPPQGYDYDDRGFFERTADEVRSWFGDEEAERRRRYDERYGEPDDRGRYGEQTARGYGDRTRGRSEDYNVGPQRQGGGYSGGGSGFGGNGPAGFGGQGRSGFGGASAGSSDLGAGRGAGATMGYGLGAGEDREQWGHDPNYRSWRDRQVESFDRDYDEYRREHQSKFESEFSNWRTGRQTQRDSLGRVREHQDVVGSDGSHVGTVDKVRGDQIILTKSDPDAGGHHHAIPSSWIETVDDKVTLRKTAEQAKAHWTDVERNSAFGGNDRDRAPWSTQSRTDSSATSSATAGGTSTASAMGSDDKEAPRATDRSFPGTY